MTTPEAARTQIEKFAKKFKALSERQIKSMNEDATRQGFILPLFEALGWELSNVNEVCPEEKISRGYVDYSFHLGGVPRFFLETKRAGEDLNDPRWVKQTIDYAWTKNVTWALLSNFKELRVFNAEWKTEDPFRAEFISFNVDTYLNDFARLWWLSREQTLLSKLDTEADRWSKRAKRLPVSQHLFDDLKTWRIKLFRDLKGYNPLYSQSQIDEAVLRLLNRLIFIRTAEDRLVEPSRLRSLVRELKDKKQYSNLWKELTHLFREMDQYYNSELFAPHFSEQLDAPTPTVLEDVIEGLYEKNFVRYNFNAIEADVLGTAYEQYLGSIVTENNEIETDTGQGYLIALSSTTVEERRQKRKNQGIYYTPSFVTKYIVQETLGKYLIENGYNPNLPPHILDMACGSGSFLIQAFDVLDGFVARQNGNINSESEELHDFTRRMDLLTTSIYGIDKDKQAVDVARLNLLLRALHSRQKLPLLKNIRHGNSLISGTPEELSSYFGDNWKLRLPFDWGNEYPDILNEGGFDIVIGNPPYIRANNMDKDERGYWQTSGKFTTITGKFDIFILFMEQAINLLKTGGRLGFIIPYPFLNQNYGQIIREKILDSCAIESIYDLSKYKVFEDAAVSTCVIVLRKEPNSVKRNQSKIKIIQASSDIQKASEREVLQKVFQKTPQHMYRILVSNDSAILHDKAWKLSKPMQDYCYVGIGMDVHDTKTELDKSARISSRIEGETYKPYVEGKEIGRYEHPRWSRYIDYIPTKMHRPKYPEMFENEKILVQVVVGRDGIIATLDTENLYAEQSLSVCLLKHTLAETGKKDTKATPEQIQLSKQHSIRYILGLLCSKFIKWYFTTWLSDELHVVPENLRRLPIRHINFEDSTEKLVHDTIVSKVEEMLTLQKEYAQAKREKEDSRFAIYEHIQNLDNSIDELVFKLYGLTEEQKLMVLDYSQDD